MTVAVLFGYRHVDGIPLCPCRDPGNYVACESDSSNPLAFTLRCWCGRSIKGTWDDEADKLAFLQANDGLTDDQRERFIAAAERGLAERDVSANAPSDRDHSGIAPNDAGPYWGNATVWPEGG